MLRPPLLSGQVHLWRIALEAARSELLQRAYALLTGQERERAARMRAGLVREEFIAGRGCLRSLLGTALERDPRAIELATGPHGKPCLADGSGVWFNVAHSRGLVLIALCRGGEVGVDVEFVDPSIEALEIARGSFHPADVARIERAPTEAGRVAEFYRCWTRKEAVMKADGRGLTLDLAGFATGADGSGEQAVEIPGGAETGPRRFFVREIDLGALHRGALATVRPGMTAVPLNFGSVRGDGGEGTEKAGHRVW